MIENIKLLKKDETKEYESDQIDPKFEFDV